MNNFWNENYFDLALKVNYYVGCMISQPNRLFQRSTTMSLINNISMSYESTVHHKEFHGSAISDIVLLFF